MKKLLTVFVCVLLGVGSSWAENKLKITTKLYVSPNGGGKVVATTTSSIPQSDWNTQDIDQIILKNNTDGHTGCGFLDRSCKYQWDGYGLYYHAKANAGYTFMGWSNDNNESVDDNQNTTPKNLSYTDPITQTGERGITWSCPDKVLEDAETRYAVFKKIINTNTTLFTWTLSSNLNPQIEVQLTNSNKVNIDIENTSNTNGMISAEPTGVQEGTGIMYLRLTANEDVQDGDTYTIKLTENSNQGEALIQVTIKNSISVTLVPPTLGEGCIETIPVVGGDKESVCSNEATGNTFKLTNSASFNQKLTATPGIGYQFFRWVINGDPVKLASNPYTYFLNDGDRITAEFLPENTAFFVVVKYQNGIAYTNGNEYYSLKDAIAATTTEYNTIVVQKSGILYNLDFALDENSNRVITIPSGITLLVPGNEAYTVTTTLREEDLDAYKSVMPQSFRQLEIPSKTKILVQGNICVYSKTSHSQRWNGLPLNYGEIKMQANTQIDLENGSKLTVLGYISGNPETSQIEAKSGSSVFEVFQMRDWRGGTEALAMRGNSSRVFPINQYYIQNIETKIIFHSGAREIVGAGTKMTKKLTGDITVDYTIPINMTIFSKYIEGEENDGLFCMGDNTTVTKWYDKDSDRQVYQISGNGKSTSNVYFGTMSASLTGTPMGTISLNSADYVLPITNNMDIIATGVTMNITSQLALLAGASLQIATDASIITSNDIIVYDKEHNSHISGNGYWHPVANHIQPVAYSVANGWNCNKRTEKNLTDAQVIINGEFVANGAFCTTTYREMESFPGLSPDPLKYGAYITSTASGKVIFNTVAANNKVTYQYIQSGDGTYVTIPVTNARLHNADGSWSAGENASVGDEYIYSSKGKWVKPTDGLEFRNATNNTFNVRLPEEYIDQSVSLSVITNEVLKITDFDITWPQDNQYFAKIEDQEATYENKTLIMPIRYTIQGVHNKDITPNTYTGNIHVSYTYVGSDEKEYTVEETIELSAIEDYTPEFTAKIIGAQGVSYESSYSFPNTTVGDSKSARVEIVPVATTVAKDLNADGWNITAIDAPVFSAALGEGEQFLSNASVSFAPKKRQKYTGSMTIVATYIDANNNSIDSEPITIMLEGEGALQTNSLAFDPNLANKTIIQGEAPIKNIFKHLGSGIGNITTITCTYVVGGTDASALVTITKENGNYTLTALEPNNPAITEARDVTITVHQNPSEIMAGTGDKPVKLTVTILPPAVWNWADLYFGSTNTIPVTPRKDGEWSLNLTTNPNNLISLTNISEGEEINYQAIVGEGAAGQVYQAEFVFTQGNYTKEFTSNIYADPRVLGYCVEYSHQFRGVSTKNSTVTFAEGHDAIPPTTTFRPADIWEIMMIGIPDKLTFTASGEKIWYISESSTGAANSYTPIVSGETLSGEQVLQLRPTTNYVKFEYGAGAGNGTISNLCISALELASAQDVVYFPIYKNGGATTKEIVFTHSEKDIAFTIQEANSGLTINQPQTVRISIDDGNESYYQTTVTISDGENGDLQRIVKGEYTLTATMEGADPINVTIYADEVPQGLPIHLATDDVKRYHFIAIEELSRYARWDAGSQSIIFQDPGNNHITRSVTLTFEGAPSRISFRSDIQTGWTVEQSVTGASDSYNPCVAQKDGDKITYSLHYTTRYVRINYLSPGREVVSLRNLVIEGDPMLIVNPEELEFSKETQEARKQLLTLTAINLKKIKIALDNNIDFQMTHSKENEEKKEYILLSEQYPDALGINKVGDIKINVNWVGEDMVNDGMITIYNILDDGLEVELARVKLVAAGKYLKVEDAEHTGIYTGVPNGSRDLNNDGELSDEEVARKFTFHGKDYTDYEYHEVNLTNAFDKDGTALFDYMFIYGETTTKDASSNIDDHTNTKGSNAKTPCYVYQRDVDAYGKFDRYRFVTMIEDVNVGDKAVVAGIIHENAEKDMTVEEEDVTVPVKFISVNGNLSVYISGFAPYATTGYSKGDEGVWFFRGNHGDKLDVYLEDAHIFSRNKMQSGQYFYSRGSEEHKQFNPKFSEDYARGSGGVLVFECVDTQEEINFATAFEVSIHTRGHNVLRSNYGCFNYFFGMDPFQISAPIHVRLHSALHARMSKTTVNFDDKWPTQLDDEGNISEINRTNGFLGLKKLNNNAPSIDLGNPYTTINFNGGQVQLQNAQIVSTNYKTTLAISYRAGEYGGDKVGLKFAEGIGTDAVGGTVNFYDGTVTIEPMWVKEEYKNYYLIDQNADGEEIKRPVGTTTINGNKVPVYEYQTTCLRCPQQTYVYGGSICWLRACQHVTSKGGAPKDGVGSQSKYLGQYIYEVKEENGDVIDPTTKLVSLHPETGFPNGIVGPDGNTLASHYNKNHPYKKYGVESVTPDENNNLYFWIPEGYGGVTAEKDKYLTTWKTCMTEISAGFQALNLSGSVGGPTPVEPNEEIKYMLYCQIDENISKVIRAGTGDGEDRIYTYYAPVKLPEIAQSYFNGNKYHQINPSSVGEELQNEVLSEQPYEVTDKVFYITTATADVWQTFTAPFDVAKIWVVESYSEKKIEEFAASITTGNPRLETLKEQAKHNANLAAFFGVAMAIGTTDPLETMFDDFIEWGGIQDKANSVWDGNGNYKDLKIRGRHQLVPYDGTNWRDAHFYLNHNTDDWEITGSTEEGDPLFTPKWEIPTVGEDGILLHKGETYSMLFPYCTGCWEYGNLNPTIPLARTFWDYWSGKFLIFESVDYGVKADGNAAESDENNTTKKVHTIEGSDFLKEIWTSEELELKPNGIFVPPYLLAKGKATLTGNSTFAFLESENEYIYPFYNDPANEAFLANDESVIYPTGSFLIADLPENKNNMPARGVMRSGEIIYDQPDDDNNGNQNGTSGGGHMPTVGGGNDLFIMAIEGGINIAVAEPQMVKVLSSTGAVLFAGYITTATDVQLPTHGIYIVSGENEVQKVLY